jgi:large subunit ribosomal protein L15e
MGAYKQIALTLRNEYKTRPDQLKSRLIKWREDPSIVKVAAPTNLSRARTLGYKAKQGIIIARVRIRKGLRKREKQRGGRKPSKSGRFFAHGKSFQAMAEERAARKFANCEVVNSYYVGEDGSYKFFEAILADRNHPAVNSDSFYRGILNRKARAFRALTHSGLRHRDSVQK